MEIADLVVDDNKKGRNYRLVVPAIFFVCRDFTLFSARTSEGPRTEQVHRPFVSNVFGIKEHDPYIIGRKIIR